MRLAEFMFHQEVNQVIVPVFEEALGLSVSDEIYEVDFSSIDHSANDVIGYTVDNYLIAVSDVKKHVHNIEEVVTSLEVILEFGKVKIYQVDLGVIPLKNGRTNSFMRFKTFIKQQALPNSVAMLYLNEFGLTNDTKLYEVDYQKVDRSSAELNPPKAYVTQHGLLTTSFLCDFVLRSYIERAVMALNYKGIKLYQMEEFPPYKGAIEPTRPASVPDIQIEATSPAPPSSVEKKLPPAIRPEVNVNIVRKENVANPRHNKQMDKLKNVFAQQYVNTSKQLEEQRGQDDIDADFLRTAFQKKKTDTDE
ncbi:hypothetical protein [Niallia taxi]|uniref:hypothetical protein n=1 Tax=Niallia taxi TaxID=2499688 RepID=UPI0015F4BDDC|nr:hypothetical protein [Niallia taxi]